MHFIKRFIYMTIVLILCLASIPFAASANTTFTTDLIDGLVTKSDRLTFDLWAKDASGNKIDGSLIDVRNNEQPVAINWDDKEKTSYTLPLQVGTNDVTISYQTTKLSYTITREPANDGDVIGHFVFSLDAFTLGLGYLIEPTLVPIIKGRTAAEELDQILFTNGFTYKSTGTLKNGFYLATIYKHNLFEQAIQIPSPLKNALNGVYDEALYSTETGLGEFDINYMSGWMYAVNNIFPNVGFSDKFLLDGDVLRVQFTLAYGQDLGGGEAMGGDGGRDFFPKVNKDALTRAIATVNNKGKLNHLNNTTRITAYKNALQTIAKVDASQTEIEAALGQLQAADQVSSPDGSTYNEDNNVIAEAPVPTQPTTNPHATAANRVTSQIQTLPATTALTVADAAKVQVARQAYDALTTEAKALVMNYSKLIELEQQIQALQITNPSVPNPTPVAPTPIIPSSAVQTVMDYISKLPTTVTASAEARIKQARAAYDALPAEQQVLIANYSMLLLAELALQQLETPEQAQVTKVEQLIKAIPTTVKTTDEIAIKQARQAYDALTTTQKLNVTTYKLLVQAEQQLAALSSDKVASAAKIEQTNALIQNLPQTITISHKKVMEEARASYDALSASEKALVKQYDKLLVAEKALEAALKEITDQPTAVQQVNQLIQSLPANITAQHRALVEQTQNAYEKLTATEKKAVQHYDKLVAALEKLNQKEALAIQNGQATIAVKGSLFNTTVGASTLAALYDNTAVQTIAFNDTDGTNIIMNKNDLQAKIGRTDLTLDVQIITIGQTKELFISLNGKTVPLQLQVPTSKWANGFLLAKTETGFEAVPHFAENGTLTAKIETGRAYTYTTNKVTFTDLTTNKEEIEYLANRYVIQGSNGKFNPSNSITRAQFAAMIARAIGAKPTEKNVFTDTVGTWYADHVQALYELNIVNGTTATTFNPNATLSRQHAAIMMARVLRSAGVQQPTTYTLPYSDAERIPESYVADIAWLHDLGIMTGSNNVFGPTNHLTRAQMAKILQRTLQVAKIM